MQKEIFYIFERRGGVETVRGREGGGGEGKPKGREGGGRQQADVHQSMVGIYIVTGNEDSNQKKRKERYPGHLIKANIYTWCIYN
jgi:hypothetical protein